MVTSKKPAAATKKKPAATTTAAKAAKATKTSTTTKASPGAKAAPVPVTRPAQGPAYWLMKSEPDVYGIAELQRDGTSGWEGVRNYQARNFMRDLMKPGDPVLFYHSNATPSGVAGVARVHGAPLADPTQFDPESHYHDPGSTRDQPRWMMVPIAFVERFDDVVSLEQLKQDPALAGMPLLQRGQRLSVQPVDKQHFQHVLHLAGAKTRA